MNKTIALFLLSGFFIGCSSASKKPDNKVADGWTIAVGNGAIVDGRIGKAKDDALLDAKKSAVKQVLGTIVKGQSMSESGVLQSSTIMGKTEGFIETYEVIEWRAISQYEYMVRIRAKVNRAQLEDAIAQAIDIQGRPRMMVIVQETVNTKPQNPSVAATETEKIYVSKGFPFVDSATVDKILAANAKKIREAVQGDSNIARSLGVDAGAEVILTGTAIVTVTDMPTHLDTSMKSYQSVLAVRAIDVNTGEVLATGQANAAAPHINAVTGTQIALQKAAAQVSDQMIPVIVKKWDPNRAQTIRLLITGMDYTEARDFRSSLTELRGVDAVNPKGTSGEAVVLEVQFQGNSFVLVDRIIEHPQYKNLKVLEVKPGTAWIKQ